MKFEARYSNSRYNSEKEQYIQELTEKILDMNYGETIEFEECARILHYNIELEEEAKKFKSMMAKIKNFLIDYGYVLKTIGGIGYYILKPKQISGYCYKTYMTKTSRLLAKSERILNHTDETELSDTRMEEYENAKMLNQELQEAIEGTINSSVYYSRKDYYNSLED